MITLGGLDRDNNIVKARVEDWVEGEQIGDRAQQQKMDKLPL